MDYAVLDTDIASLSFKDQLPDEWVRSLVGRVPVVTFVTVGELLQWMELRRWGLRRRTELTSWLSRRAVIDSDYMVCQAWARLSSGAANRGRPRPQNDTWVAACCLAADMPLATRNRKDFQDFVTHDGLRLVTPE